MDVEGTYRKHTWQEPWNLMGKKSLPMKAYSKKFFFSKSILSYPPLPSWSGYGILCKIHRLELLLINVPINPYQLLFFLYTPPPPPSQKKKRKENNNKTSGDQMFSDVFREKRSKALDQNKSISHMVLVGKVFARCFPKQSLFSVIWFRFACEESELFLIETSWNISSGKYIWSKCLFHIFFTSYL